MRLVTYINESSGNTSIEEILDLLWKNCKPFLNDLISTPYFRDFMFSGRKGSKDIIRKPIRTRRDSKDTPVNIHKALDNVFYNHYGWRARSNAIFCTGSHSDATEYGDTVYMIFPVGKYKILYNKSINDLYMEVNGADFENDFDRWYKEENENDNDIYDEWEEEFGVGKAGHWEYYDKIHMDVVFIDEHFEDADDVVDYLSNPENAEKEGMYSDYFEDNPEYELDIDIDEVSWVPVITFDEFEDDYDVSSSDPGMDVDILTAFFEDTFPFIDYQTNNLLDAIRADVEIMVNCKEYIGIRADKFRNALLSYYSENGYKKPDNVKIKEWYMKNSRIIPKQLTIFK